MFVCIEWIGKIIAFPQHQLIFKQQWLENKYPYLIIEYSRATSFRGIERKSLSHVHSHEDCHFRHVVRKCSNNSNFKTNSGIIVSCSYNTKYFNNHDYLKLHFKRVFRCTSLFKSCELNTKMMNGTNNMIARSCATCNILK